MTAIEWPGWLKWKGTAGVAFASSGLFVACLCSSALPNILDILRKKQPILLSTKRLRTSLKTYLSSHSAVHQIFVTYSFDRNSQTTTTHPSPPAGTFRCNSRYGYLTCPYINHWKTSRTFTNTGETRQIKHHITFDLTNLKCCNRHFCYTGGRLGRLKIVTLRVGARVKEGKSGGGGEKKKRHFLFSLPAPYIAPFDSPHFLPSSRVSTCAFASKTFARPKKTPALQANTLTVIKIYIIC